MSPAALPASADGGPSFAHLRLEGPTTTSGLDRSEGQQFSLADKGPEASRSCHLLGCLSSAEAAALSRALDAPWRHARFEASPRLRSLARE